MDSNWATKQDLKELRKDIVEDLYSKIRFVSEERYLSKKETCKYLKISNNTLDNWISQGLPVLRINGILRFDRIAIDKWLAERV